MYKQVLQLTEQDVMRGGDILNKTALAPQVFWIMYLCVLRALGNARPLCVYLNLVIGTYRWSCVETLTMTLTWMFVGIGFQLLLPLGLSSGLFHMEIHLHNHEQSFEK